VSVAIVNQLHTSSPIFLLPSSKRNSGRKEIEKNIECVSIYSMLKAENAIAKRVTGGVLGA
jgi:hypothetical protein